MHARACAPASASSCAAVPVQHDPAVHAISTLFTFWQLCCVLILFGMFRDQKICVLSLPSTDNPLDATAVACRDDDRDKMQHMLQIRIQGQRHDRSAWAVG